MVDPLALEQSPDHVKPFGPVRIASVMIGEHDPGSFDLGPVPGIDEVDREATVTDLVNAECHFGEHHGMVEHRLDRRDDFDARRQRRQRRGCRPGFELIEGRIMRIDRVLCHQHAVEAECFGLQHECPVPGEARVVRLLGIVQRGPAAVHECPDTEAERMV